MLDPSAVQDRWRHGEAEAYGALNFLWRSTKYIEHFLYKKFFLLLDMKYLGLDLDLLNKVGIHIQIEIHSQFKVASDQIRWT